MTLFLACCLLYSEVNYFLNPGFTFKFLPDTDYEGKLSINVDLTVAMPCDRKSKKVTTFFYTSVAMTRGQTTIIVVVFLFCKFQSSFAAMNEVGSDLETIFRFEKNPKLKVAFKGL